MAEVLGNPAGMARSRAPKPRSFASPPFGGFAVIEDPGERSMKRGAPLRTGAARGMDNQLGNSLQVYRARFSHCQTINEEKPEKSAQLLSSEL